MRSADEQGKCSTIRKIVRITQMLKRWRRQAAAASRRRSVPSDVPAGHVAVSVGSSGRRFVVRATHLNHPVIRSLLEQAEEEYGFANQGGPLAIPCDELLFEDIIRFLSRSRSSSDSCSRRHVLLQDFQRNFHHSVFGAISESRSLLSR